MEEKAGIMYQRNRQILYGLNVQKNNSRRIHQMKLRIIDAGIIFYFIQFI